jgi:3-hydroxyanthranilate 3,4-dioxygenase
MIKGQMNLHYRDVDNDNKEGAHVLKEGEAIYTAPLIPHSPRFPPDAFLLVQERKRHPGEIDRFHWYCPECDAFLHEETFVVEDYTKDPVSRAYSNFFDVEAHRTCTSCGHIMPAPSGI